MSKKMSRRQARETAFVLLFEQSFTHLTMGEILACAVEAREFTSDEFANALAVGAANNREEIDALITLHAKRWKKERLSRVALSVLRLAIYEMLFCADIPVSVSINEAVEISKIYGGEEDTAFINGVLGGVARSLPEKQDNPQEEAQP